MRQRSLSLGLALLVTGFVSGQTLFPGERFPLTGALPGVGTLLVQEGLLVDLDQDGDADLVGRGSNILTAFAVCLAGGGTLAPGTGYALNPGQIFSRVVAGDLDGDGDRDLVITCSGATAWLGYMVYLNDGTGAFPTPPLFLPGSNGQIAAIANMNGDSIPDLVLYGAAAPARVCFGTGGGNFAPPITATVTTGAFIAILDDDGDGDDDLHEVTGQNFVTYRNHGFGVFTSIVRFPVVGPNVRPVFADVNLDGNVDVALVGGTIALGSSILVALGNGAGAFSPTASQTLVAAGELQPLALADFDGDGDPDLVARQGSMAHFAANVGNGVFGSLSLIDKDYSSHATGDVNGDGISDVLNFGTGFGGLQPGLPAVGPAHPTSVPVPPYGQPFKITDLNADGRPDAIVTTGPPPGTAGVYGLSVLMNLEAAPVPSQSFATVTSVNDIATGDWNKDGIVDVLAIRNPDLLLFLGSSSGNLAPPYVIPAVGQAFQVIPADVNRDGNLDVIVSFIGSVAVLFGNGTGNLVGPVSSTFCPNPLTPSCYAIPRIAVADLDRDGLVDVVAVAPALPIFPGAQTSVTPMLGNGLGAFIPLAPVVCHANTVAIDDLNGDQLPDLVLNDITTVPPKLDIRLATGGGAFGPPANYVVTIAGSSTGEVNVGDLTGEGSPDVVCSGGAVFLNDGAGGFAQRVELFGSVDARAAIADLDRDLQSDIVYYRASGWLTIHHRLPVCSAMGWEYGLGCPGSGGFIPELSAFGCPSPGGSVTLSIERALGGAGAAQLVIGPGSANIPIGFGVTVLIQLASSFVVPVPVTGPPIPGQGRAGLSVFVPAAIAPGTVVAVQAAVLDPAAAFGWSATNALGFVIK